jgi:hypothetical protein
MIDLPTLFAAAAELFDVSDGAVRDGRGRNPRMIDCRQALALVLSDRDYTTTEIGAILRRDHTTICHALKRARWRMTSDAQFAARVRALHAVVGSTSAPRTVAETVEQRRRGTWAIDKSVHIALYWWGGVMEPVTA